MWALPFTWSYSTEPFGVPGTMLAVASPPWQSVQPRRTVRVGCMVGSSIPEWHKRHPALFRSTSSGDWVNSVEDCDCALKRCSRTNRTTSAARNADAINHRRRLIGTGLLQCCTSPLIIAVRIETAHSKTEKTALSRYRYSAARLPERAPRLPL